VSGVKSYQDTDISNKSDLVCRLRLRTVFGIRMSRLRFFSVFAVSYGVEVCHKCSSHCLGLNNGQTLGTFAG